MAGLKVKDEYEGLTEAVSLSIAVLKKCRSNTWAELMEAMGSGDAFTVKTLKALDLSAAQLAVMDRFSPVVKLVTIKPATVPAVCPVCGLYILTADTAPTRCLVTAGCAGKPFKVAAATAGPSPEAAEMLPADYAVDQPTATEEPSGGQQDDPVADWVPELDAVEETRGDESEADAAGPDLEITDSDLGSFDDFEDFDDRDVAQTKGPRPVIDLDEDPFA